MLQALIASTGALHWQVQSMGMPVLVDGVLYSAGGNAVDSVSVQALDATTGKTLWTHAQLPGAGGPAYIQPVLANGVVYIGTSQSRPESGSQSGIYALRASDGALLWRYPAISTNFIPFTVDDGMIAVTAWTSANPSEAVSVLALRASDGKLLWTHPADCDFSSQHPVVATGGVVYYIYQAWPAGQDIYHIYALRASDGKTLWQH